MNEIRSLAIWLVFSVLFSLVHILFALVLRRMSPSDFKHLTILGLLGNGSLFFFGMTLTAAAFGQILQRLDVFASVDADMTRVFQGLCVIAMVLGGGIYTGIVSLSPEKRNSESQKRAFSWSACFCIGTIVVAGLIQAFDCKTVAAGPLPPVQQNPGSGQAP